MVATAFDPATERVIRRLRAVAIDRRQDRGHSMTAWLTHTRQADALLDELLALHPEWRHQRPPLGAPSTDGAAQATPVQAT